jgi:hypothetical protein
MEMKDAIFLYADVDELVWDRLQKRVSHTTRYYIIDNISSSDVVDIIRDSIHRQIREELK